MWFNGWNGVIRAALFSIVTYVLLLVLIRALGRRTIAKMNPGDFAVIVAVGSVVGGSLSCHRRQGRR